MEFERAIVVGCDKKYEHTLSWWLNQYQKNNDLPIIFANFGVSEPVLRQAHKVFSKVVDVYPENGKFSWGLKQRAVLEAGVSARWVMWVDLDCEVNGNLDTFFDFMKFDDDFGISLDIPAFRYPGDTEISENHLQAGLFVTSSKGRVFRRWLEELPLHKCDQRAISSIYHNEKSLREFFKLYDWDMHCPRLALPFQIQKLPKLPKVIHWTGQVGDNVVAYKSMLSNIGVH
ncbi:hypothetical protein N9M50_06710 [Alphaproteobacteria bacterium]|nr:hypothetical protein [Alphaproteobacteria bacterium]